MSDNVKALVPATIQPVQSVVETMEMLLEKAKSGEMRSFVLAAVMSENRYYTTVECEDMLVAMGLMYSALHAAAAHGRENAEAVN